VTLSRMRAHRETDPGDPGDLDALVDPDIPDPEDAFGHPAIPDPARDDAVWSDGDEDDIDV